MLTFKQFIAEVTRSPERAAKLVDNLHKRRNRGDPSMSKGPVLFPKATHGGKRNDKWNNAVWNRASELGTAKFKEKPNPKYSKPAEVRDVPMSKIRDIQGAVGAKGVKREIKAQTGNREFGHTNSSEYPEFLHHRKTDTYLPTDGNHRTSASRALGNPSIKAKVRSI